MGYDDYTSQLEKIAVKLSNSLEEILEIIVILKKSEMNATIFLITSADNAAFEAELPLPLKKLLSADFEPNLRSWEPTDCVPAAPPPTAVSAAEVKEVLYQYAAAMRSSSASTGFMVMLWLLSRLMELLLLSFTISLVFLFAAAAKANSAHSSCTLSP